MELDKYVPLFDNVMKGKWEHVFKDYNKREYQVARISRSKDTVLHIAVLKGEKEHVVQLVNMIRDEDAEKVLSAQNENGNTPLHLAAALGNEEMCRRMAEKCPKAISIQNADCETPLLVSALFGNTNAFDCLHEVYCKRIGDAYPLCRKGNDGDTILHAAISAENFSLAYKIIKRYPKMANAYNMEGQTPLHALANMPHAFESGSNPGLFDWTIYNCVIVSEREKETTDLQDHWSISTSKASSRYPQNYETCMRICIGIVYHIRVLFQKKISMRRKGHNDEESQQQNNKTSDRSVAGSTPSGVQEEPHCSIALSNDPENLKPENASNEEANYSKKKPFCPPNYETIVHLLRSTIRLLLVILGLGIFRIKEIKETKEKHRWATLLMNEIIDKDDYYKCEGDGMEPQRNEHLSALPETDDTKSSLIEDANPRHRSELLSKRLEPYHTAVLELNESWENPLQEVEDENRDKIKLRKFETAFLVAAKMGVKEIIRSILEKHPVAIRDQDSKGRNVFLLAVEYRQINVCNDLLNNENILKERVFRKLDYERNSALHLAAKYGGRRPWLNITGDALEMQWEMKWFEFVKDSMPQHFIARKNKDCQTPNQVLMETHKDLVQKGGDWLIKTSESCSVVAALIATVAFTTATAIPGGVNGEGAPNLKDQPLFHAYCILSLVALCTSVSSVVLFLTILTSRLQEKDFAKNLPRKLLLGLTTLFASIATILISFCLGHFFLLKESLKHAVYPIYVVTLLPVTYFGLAQLHLYSDLIKSVFIKMPQPSYTV